MTIFQDRIDVRFRDLDATGHVNNAVLLVYFGEVRRRFFSEFLEGSDPSNFPFIMARMKCSYLEAISLTDELSLQIWVKEIGNKSFILGYRLINASDDNKLYVTAESVQVCYDYTRGSTIEIPVRLREALKKYWEAGPAGHDVQRSVR